MLLHNVQNCQLGSERLIGKLKVFKSADNQLNSSSGRWVQTTFLSQQTYLIWNINCWQPESDKLGCCCPWGRCSHLPSLAEHPDDAAGNCLPALSNVLLNHWATKQVHARERGCLSYWFEHSHGSLRVWTLLPGLFMHFTWNSHRVTYNPQSKPSGGSGKATPSFWILIRVRCEMGWAAWPCQDWGSSGHAWRWNSR